MNSLSILGCEPKLLNSLMELAEEALDITQFNILLNIPVNIGAEFQPHSNWQHDVYTLGTLNSEEREKLAQSGQFAFSMAHSPVKAIVYQAFKKLLPLAYERTVSSTYSSFRHHFSLCKPGLWSSNRAIHRSWCLQHTKIWHQY